MAPIVIGHRGAPALAPENTLSGIREAQRAGLDWVELDVMLTRDRVPVIFHDHRLERLTGTNGFVSQTLSDDVVGLSVSGCKSPENTVPTLADALALVVELSLNLSLEIKVNRLAHGRTPERWQVATAETVCAVLGTWRPTSKQRIILGSFHAACLHVARERLPQCDRDFKVGRHRRGWRQIVAETTPQILSFDHLYDGPRRIADYAGRVSTVWAYTINDPIAARKLAGRGVSGIYTDRPGPILAGFDRP